MKSRQTIISAKRVFLTLGITALLSACATVSETVTQAENGAGELISENRQYKTPDNKSDNSVNSNEEPTQAAFPEEVLYQLLVADIALIRGQFEFALKKYLQQARETRDIAVIEMANRIASHQGNTQVTVETAELWLEVSPNQAIAHRAALQAYALQADPLKALPHAYWLYSNNDDIEAFLAVTSIAEGSQFAEDSKSAEGSQFAEGSKSAEGSQFAEGSKSAEGSKQELLAALIEAYENLALEPDKQPTVKLAQAILYREAGQLEIAVKTVEQFLLLAPDNQRGLLFLVQTLQQQDRMTEALSRLEEALQRVPNNQSLRLQYARFLTITDRSQAIVQFEMLRLKNSDNQQVNFLLALLYLNQGSVERAVNLFKQAATDPSLYADAQYHLGSIADRQGDIGSALLHYREVRNGRNYLASASRTALLLAELQSMDIARTYLQQLRLEQPSQSASLFQVESNLLLGSDQPDLAFTVLSNGLQAHPNSTQLLYARSMVAELQDNFELAERDLRSLLTQDADNSTALNALGYTMLIHTDRHTEAHKLIKRAYLLNPGDPAILDSLGWVLFILGDAQQALSYLEKAMAIMTDPEIAAHLGEVQWFLGDRQAAMQTWKRGFKQGPDHKTLKETVDRHRKHFEEALDAEAFGIESTSTIINKPSDEKTP